MMQLKCTGCSLTGLGILLCLFTSPLHTAVQRSRSIPAITYRIIGLTKPAEILIDPWGIPHIYALTFRDVFFVQGFNAARDRLWQIDLWRRQGLGQLAEVLGPRLAEKDRASRLFLYRGNMEAEWNAYGPGAKEIAMAFVEGINAYVQLTEQNPVLLPVEFKLLGYKPAFWLPDDVVRIRSHGLWRNVRSEVERAQCLCKFGQEVEKIRSRLEPPWQVMVPKELHPCLIPENVLRVYDLATSTLQFSEETTQLRALLLRPIQGSAADKGNMDLKWRAELSHPWNEHDPEVHSDFDTNAGSNNWAISSRLTATGRPILANDPHRVLRVPSLRYGVHLAGPDLNVIGAGEPFLPGISIGHNDSMAFGLTIFPIDQEDLFVYQTNMGNPNEYKYRGQREPMKVLKDSINVKGQEPVTIELKYTRHGPVIYEDKDKNLAFALRAVWLEPGMAPYFGSIQSMRTTRASDFLTSMKHWGGPSLNHVFADTKGSIGWKPWGRTPIRPNWDGLLPVPGNGEYEWAGFYNTEMLPAEINPSRGWVASANQMNLPEDFPYKDRKIGFEWSLPWRYQRIAEVLSQTKKATMLDSLQLQTDVLSIPARRMVALMRDLRSDDSRVSEVLERIRSWDLLMSSDSVAAAVFEIWYRLVREALLTELIPSQGRKIVKSGDERVLLEILERPDQRLGTDPVAKRDQILLTNFSPALKSLESSLGPALEEWAWGRLHHASFPHPLLNIMGRNAAEKLRPGSPVPRGGSRATVNFSDYDKDFCQRAGASWRIVLDVGNWDNSLAMNTPGQSGDPSSPHYSDLLVRWAKDQAFPLLYSRERIEAVAEERIVLEPLH